MGTQKLTGAAGKVGAMILANGVRLFSGSGAPTDGTSGTGAGKAVPSSKFFDYTNGNVWINIGTKASPVWVSEGVFSKAVTISNAEIKALRATPKTLVAAPGAGKLLELVGGTLLHDYGSNALTESADNLGVRYGDGSGTQISETIEAGGFVDATADTMTTIRVKQDGIVAKSACENKALVLHNLGDGEFGGNAAADTVWRAKILYRVWATGW